MKKIGVLGGTFDPPHLGHLAAARLAIKAVELAEVRFMPAWTRKTPDGARTEHRVAMVRLAIADEPSFGFEELEVATEGREFTFDLIIHLRAAVALKGGRLYWIIGADGLRDMPTRWRGGFSALDLCTFIVVPREGCNLDGVPADVLAKVLRVGICPPDISSSMVRERIRAGEGVDDLVPPAVARYITAQRLYRPKGD